MRKLAFVSIVSAFSLAPALAVGVVYDEAVDGDLSGNRLAPTSLSLGTGISSISGTTVAGDLDYVTFNVPGTATLNSMTLARFTSTDDLGFLAIQVGTTFTEPPSGTNISQLDGYSHFGTGTGVGAPVTNVGEDTLAKMSTAPGATGFTLPLGAGDYTLWIQQTNLETVGYKFELAVVPEPSSWVLLGVGFAGLLVAARRRT